ncbi:STAS domain-containing protein [Nocardioides mesophilus]|uniref:Anti-sigma factor antagonist n=1 Tax=Nocardioides mesophilus TaxID=433659 RepID=A0A7G9RCS2_9ACTN|nr:STAS domain-containing protein [Nocardioides mesophilus]QNN53397.1 STAS domain-containing protein [Nocardioides mesophilus]
MDFSLDVHRSTDCSVITLVGEVDLTTAEQLKQALRDAAAGVDLVVVDLAKLTFLDSTGLAALLSGHKLLAASGGRLELRDPPAMVVKMVGIVGLDDLFVFTSS